MEVSASDNDVVDRVEFFVDGSLEAIDSDAPYQFSLLAPFGKTELELMGTAFDLSGNSASASRTVPLDPDLPPMVQIVQPVTGQQIFEGTTITIEAEANDDVGVATVVLEVNGTELPFFTGPPYTFEFVVGLGDGGTN